MVRELYASHGGRRVIYRDSSGSWDELVHDGAGNFRGYGPARDMAPKGVA